MSPEQLLQAAATLYARGERERVLQVCLSLLGTPVGGAAWELAALCLADQGRWADLVSFIDQASLIGFPAASFTRQWMHSLQKRGWLPLLDRLVLNLPQEHVGWLMAVYYAASARLVAGDREAALQGFDRFRLNARAFMGVIPFALDPNFNVIFRQGTTVLPAEAAQRRIAASVGLKPLIEDFRILQPAEPKGDGPVVMAAADGVYAARFAPGLLASLDAPGRFFHLHVVNPTPQSDAAIAEASAGLRHLTLEISASTDSAYATATAYSCARFAALPPVLARHGRPVLLLDIDVEATAAFASLERVVTDGGFDFACFLMARNDPASLYSACVMGYAPGEATSRFLGLIVDFVRPRLAMPVNFNWMLDQAALISVVNLLSVTGDPFRFRDFNTLTGRVPGDFVTLPAGEMEKQAIKAHVSGITAEMVDASGWAHFDWQPD
jgi:hypothetical protein